MNDTPRTDKIAHAGLTHNSYAGQMTHHARELERELNRMQDKLAASESANAQMREALIDASCACSIECDRCKKVSLALSLDAGRELLAELERLRSMSTVEMMGENLNVRHHVTEWEERCLKAENERDAARKEAADWRERVERPSSLTGLTQTHESKTNIQNEASAN